MDQAKVKGRPQAEDETAGSSDETRSAPNAVEAKGYTVSRLNATKHGLLSKHAILPWEDRAEYDALHDSLVEEHQPRGPTEAHLVEELAGIMWRKRRLRLAEASTIRFGLAEITDQSRKEYEINPPPIGTAEAALADVAHNRRIAREMPLSAIAVSMTEEEAAKELERIPAALAAIEKALNLLSTRDPSTYKTALATLEPETRTLWEDALHQSEVQKAKTRDELEVELMIKGPRRPVIYEATADALASWLEGVAATKHQISQIALERREVLRNQAFGDALKPGRLQNLSRYETHLDRKFERTLGMLIKVREIRRACETV